jgi:hypothetical protein
VYGCAPLFLHDQPRGYRGVISSHSLRRSVPANCSPTYALLERPRISCLGTTGIPRLAGAWPETRHVPMKMVGIACRRRRGCGPNTVLRVYASSSICGGRNETVSLLASQKHRLHLNTKGGVVQLVRTLPLTAPLGCGLASVGVATPPTSRGGVCPILVFQNFATDDAIERICTKKTPPAVNSKALGRMEPVARCAGDAADGSDQQSGEDHQ